MNALKLWLPISSINCQSSSKICRVSKTVTPNKEQVDRTITSFKQKEKHDFLVGEFTCFSRGDTSITIVIDQMCDGVNDCPGLDEDFCPNDENDDNTGNEIASKNE